jgi:hypothetical protein
VLTFTSRIEPKNQTRNVKKGKKSKTQAKFRHSEEDSSASSSPDDPDSLEEELLDGQAQYFTGSRARSLSKIWKQSDPPEALITKKIQENCRLSLIESVNRDNE